LKGRKRTKQEKKITMRSKVEKKSVIAVILAVCGFVLIYLGTTVTSLFFLPSVGVWIIIAVWIWDVKRTEKKEGKKTPVMRGRKK
jgi:hypothetical protein